MTASSLLLSSHDLDGKRNNPYRERVLFEESDMPHIHEVATLTSKGQITLPKSIRQALDPGLDEYRQGNTMGRDYRHWRRAKIWRRFRLFFRYDSRTRVIVYAWSMMNRACAPPAASPIPTLYFGKCWNEGSRLMTGQPYSRQTSQIGHERRGLASHQSANICLSMSHGQVFGNADRPLP